MAFSIAVPDGGFDIAGALPRVLAGPIIRRVELRGCSFWVALSQEATVKAQIWKGEQSAPVSGAETVVGSAELKTQKIAASLHVAVVTVDLTGTPLTAGELYSYNLTFAFTGVPTSDLRGEQLLAVEKAGSRLTGVDSLAPLHLPLGFENDKLPSFLAPSSTFTGPEPAKGLRIAHCSCRRAGGGSYDALAALAPLIRSGVRPHQLCMTGDQVYADDISTALIGLVIGLGADISGTAQPLPALPADPRVIGGAPGPAGLPGNLANLPPLRRKWLLWKLAGFTGSDVANHAITFPEFAALHLMAWSPRVWRKIPAFEDVHVAPGIAGHPAPAPDAAIAGWLNRPWFCSAANPSLAEDKLKQDWANPAVNTGDFGNYNAAAHHLTRYAGAVPLVAQVLANTPTYMIFDDHEIADDWNLNGRWATKVYSLDWGRFVVRNGLMAYTLMQGWGNDPAHFAADKPGGKLLAAIPAAVAGDKPAAVNVDILVGVDKTTNAQPKRAAFNYTAAEGDDYRVVVLDTRTHRAVSTTSLQPPNLIDNLDDQLPASSVPPAKKVLVVVSAVPVFSPVVVEQIGQPLAQLAIDNVNASKIGEIPGFVDGDKDLQHKAGCDDRGERGAEKYDREGWSANEPAFEALIARLAGYKSVVILSGDVHYASMTTLDYWPGEEISKPARLVSCVSSPAKNIFKRQVEVLVARMGSLQRAAEVPMERLAWKTPIDPALLIKPGAHLPLARRSRLRRTPALVPTKPWPKDSALPATRPPDWRWRIEIVVDLVTKRINLPAGLQLEPVPANVESLPRADRITAVAGVHQTRLLQARPLVRRLVFAANVGLVQFEQTAAGTDVVHRLYSPISAEPFSILERKPFASAEPPPDPGMAFGPHTVHRAALATPAGTPPPTIIADG